MLNQNMLNQNSANRIPINPNQFQQMAHSITDNMLEQLARQAQSQGISNKDIETGLDYILKMR